MLKPKYLEQLPSNLIELYSQLEMDILDDMARRISTYDYYIPAAQWQYKKIIELGNYNSFITKALASRTGKTEKEIKRLMEEAAMETLSFDDAIYEGGGLKSPPLSASPALLDVLNAGIEKTNGLFKNLTRTTAGASARQFEYALDRAYLQIVSGAFNQNTAIRNAIKSLVRGGVSAVTYPQGRVDNLETAVRRAIVTGVNQTALKLQDARADEVGCDLVETTAHGGARPSHAEWQGRVFSRSGKSSKYPDFRQATRYGYGDGLGGWNCRHSYFPFFEGISPKAYSVAGLQDYEAKKYWYDGRKLTEYEASQIQRGIERNIRRWKREEVAMRAAGLPTEEAKAKVSKWQGEQRSLIEQTGLKRQSEREQIYSKSVVKSRESGIIKRNGMERKHREGYVEPMPKKQLRRITKNFQKNGGIMQMDNETDAYLASKDAEAITYDAHTILLRQNPGRASVFEELIHTAQYRNGENDGSYESRLHCEILAQEKLIKYKNAYRLSDAEVNQTRSALESYKKELREYLKKG